MGIEQRIFRAVNLLCLMLKWRTHVIIHLSQHIECTKPRMSLNVNYGLWVIITCPRRFTNSKNVSVWCCMPIVLTGVCACGVWVLGKSGSIWELCTSYWTFHEAKMLQKKVKKKKEWRTRRRKEKKRRKLQKVHLSVHPLWSFFWPSVSWQKNFPFSVFALCSYS